MLAGVYLTAIYFLGMMTIFQQYFKVLLALYWLQITLMKHKNSNYLFIILLTTC